MHDCNTKKSNTHLVFSRYISVIIIILILLIKYGIFWTVPTWWDPYHTVQYHVQVHCLLFVFSCSPESLSDKNKNNNNNNNKLSTKNLN